MRNIGSFHQFFSATLKFPPAPDRIAPDFRLNAQFALEIIDPAAHFSAAMVRVLKGHINNDLGNDSGIAA